MHQTRDSGIGKTPIQFSGTAVMTGVLVGFLTMYSIDNYITGWTSKFVNHYRHVNFLKTQACSEKAKSYVSRIDSLSPLKYGGGMTGRAFWGAWMQIVQFNDGMVAPFCENSGKTEVAFANKTLNDAHPAKTDAHNQASPKQDRISE